jgi:hypothetical protein
LENGKKKIVSYIFITFQKQNESYTPKVLQQKLEISGRSFQLKNIYETEKSPALSSEEPSSNLCCICMQAEINTVVFPCRHMCLCTGCAKECQELAPSNPHCRKCPMCRKRK